MDRIESYRRNAEKAERKAREATSQAERDAYVQIAKGWRDLQAQEQRREKRGF